MSEERFEDVSAWMDGALSKPRSEKLVGSVSTDPELRQAWSRYHLIGDALRGDLPQQLETGLAERVRACIEREAPIAAAPLPVPQVLPPRVRSPYVAWALAASLGGMAVMAAQTWREYLPMMGANQLTASLSGDIAPLPIATQRWRGERTVPSSRLSSYLVSHSRFQTDMQLEGVLPYVRLVGYEAEQ